MNTPCPVCRGIKFWVNPRMNTIDACTTCDGTGSVNPEYRCGCGRPAVRPIADEVVCTRDECMAKAMGLVGVK